MFKVQKTLYFATKRIYTFENEPKQRELIQALEDLNLSILNEVGEIVNNENCSDRDKIVALKSLVALKMQDVKVLLEDKSSSKSENLNKYDFSSKSLKITSRQTIWSCQTYRV